MKNELNCLLRKQKVMLLILGLLDRLTNDTTLSEQGQLQYNTLRQTDFQPTTEEIDDCVRFLNGEANTTITVAVLRSYTESDSENSCVESSTLGT